MDILSELTDLKAEHSAAQTLLEEAKVSHDTLQTLIADKESQLHASADLVASKEKTIADLGDLIAGKDSAIADLHAQIAALNAKDKTAEEKAVDLVASQGIKPLKVDAKGMSDAISKEEVIAQLSAIRDPVERANYYFANKAALFAK